MRPRLSTSAAAEDVAEGPLDKSPVATLAAPNGNGTKEKRDGAGARPKNHSTISDAGMASIIDPNTRLSANSHTRRSFESRTSIDVPDNARSRRTSRDNSRETTSWKAEEPENGQLSNGNGSAKKDSLKQQTVISVSPIDGPDGDKMPAHFNGRRSKFRSRWSNSCLTFSITALAILALGLIVQSFATRQLDDKGCRMSYMRPAFAKLDDFDTEHTRFASKYSTYLYREVMVDEDIRVYITVALWGALLTMVSGQGCSSLVHPRKCRQLQAGPPACC